ncbi:MAG TPA: hypothetical protein VHM19_21510 [Polyangiales bacterium]|jgi:hypothetical protein|nr:hypothetical protein [Polyangiales bacterium]
MQGNKVLTKLGVPFLAVASILGATGCLVGNSSGEPVLAVDLYWDENPKADRFSEGTCESAGVVTMDWTLIDKHTKKKVVSANDVDCQDGFNFEQVGPGNYQLKISGYDDNDQELWSTTCDDLTLDRFDSVYSCDVDQ